MSSRSIIARIFALLPLSLLVLFLIVDPLLLNPSQYGLLGVCLGLASLIYYLRDESINVPLLIGGTIAILVSLWSAVTSGYFWNPFEYSFVLILVVLAGTTAAFTDRTDAMRITFVALLALGSAILASIVFQYVRQFNLFGVYGLARLPTVDFRNPNVLARFLGMIGLGLFATGRSLPSKLTSVPFVFLLVLSGSRGAILGVMAVLIVALVNKFEISWQSMPVRVGFVTAVILLLVSLVFFSSSIARVTTHQRIDLVHESLALVAEAPFIGTGPWNFGLLYPEVSLDGTWQRHPHSLPLWLLTSFGLLGTLILLGTFWNVDGSVRWEFTPVFVFVGVHELVDTMIWIPGVLLLTVLLLGVALKGRTRPSRQLTWFPVLAVPAVLAGGLIWKTDADFKAGLKEFHARNYTEARLNWWNDLAGFTLAHKATAHSEEGNLERADRLLERATTINALDPYYHLLAGRISEARGESVQAKRHREQYREMDPRKLLTLSRSDSSDRSATEAPEKKPPSFVSLWYRQRKPIAYLPLVKRTIDSNDTNLAKNQIRFLLGLPKITQRGRTLLLQYRAELSGRGHDKSAPDRLREHRQFRSQFHHFLYRRPGSDYVSFRTLN
ncbi:MAG: O-antigen ligase family protein [bacterium]